MASKNDAGEPRPRMGLLDVRRHHLSLVLDHLVRSGPRSRAALAQETGLTKATVSALVADLLARQLVEEREPVGGRIGRPATDIAVSHTVVALGLQVDADRVAACVLDIAGDIRSRHSRGGDHRDAEPATVLELLREVTAEAMADIEAADLWCAGGALAVPGLVDETGELFVAANLHWLDVDLTAPQSRLGLPPSFPIVVDNEANLAALAELRHGLGRDLTSFVYVSGGVGVGAGAVIDGRIVRGANGFAGELGHVVVDPSGVRCACGTRGCLETVVGARRRTSSARRADALAAAFRNVVHLLDPEAVILGGSLAAGDEEIADAVAERLRETTLGGRWRPCPVLGSALGPDAALIGAATVAIDDVIADPTTVPVDPLTQTA
ncbi:MAG: ROK family transcriptional regulator [Acidimicrobiales bacterium]|nr:ROK family transcriptional regulator [Acidimicrobiales bacterium]